MRAVAVLAIVVAAVACKRADDAAPKKETSTTTAPAPAVASADGTRHVTIEANKDGYAPDRVAGKPNEKLVLDVTRTIDAECLAKLVTPDKKSYDLPLNKQVAIPVTVPDKGELTFACGMDMFHGTIVAQP